jgi:hypothetical protein
MEKEILERISKLEAENIELKNAIETDKRLISTYIEVIDGLSKYQIELFNLINELSNRVSNLDK